MNKDKNDFSQGSVVKNIMSLAVPMTLAQLINVLYNIVDRIYIGRIPQDSTITDGNWPFAADHYNGDRVCQSFRDGRSAALLY